MAGKDQRNVDGSLELRGLALEPSAGGPFEISPDVRRVIANLAALDGVLTRLLRCTKKGHLYVASIPETVQPDGEITANIDAAATETMDFGSAKPRCVTLSGDLGPLSAYDSDSSGGYSRGRVILGGGVVGSFHTRGRYLDIYNHNACTATVLYSWIDLE